MLFRIHDLCTPKKCYLSFIKSSHSKVEIEPFDGNPINYHSFMALFREHVDNTKLTPSTKLSRLVQYTTSPAKKAILPCVMQGEGGYDEDLSILKKRFGSTILITECLIRGVKTGKPIKTPQDLKSFSDDPNSCHAIVFYGQIAGDRHSD